jgi:hypothetical protein
MPDHPSLLPIDEQERLYWERNPRGSNVHRHERVAETLFQLMRAEIHDVYYDPEYNDFRFLRRA